MTIKKGSMQSGQRVRVGYLTRFWVAPILALTGAQAHAQVIERHAPQVPQNESKALALPNLLPQDQDDKSFGTALTGITLLDKNDVVLVAPHTGVSVDKLARLAPISVQITQDLTPYLGRKLSKKLIAEIEASLAKRYRKLGYPFVAFFTPEQDISSGIVQIRVVEFRVGEIVTKGAAGKDAEALKATIGLHSGDAINTPELAEDLAWLNRYPFAQVQAIFSPAKTLGDSDLSLIRTTAKPWQIYAGYDNSGSRATGHDRMYLGATVGNLLGHDSVLSYQATGSRDIFEGALAHPNYISHALSYRLPVTRHSQIEAGFDTVETNQDSNPFTVRLNIYEANLAYRFGVRGLIPTGETDVRLGVSAKYQKGITFFAGANVFQSSVEDYQLIAGLHHADTIHGRPSDWDVAVHLSPGNVTSGNSDAQVLLYSQSRQTKASYVYVTFNYNQLVPLGPVYWRTTLTGQWTNTALPRSEQSGLGGASLVRGYDLDDGAFDEAIIWRNELGPRAFKIARAQLSPFVFIDAGVGRDLFLKQSQNLVSAGVGANLSIAPTAGLRIDAAHTLRDGAITTENSNRVEVGFSLRF